MVDKNKPLKLLSQQMLTLTGKNKFVTMANRRSLKELKATCDPC
jgi:hypothetical protein